MDLLGSLKKPAGTPGVTTDIPGLSARLPGAKTAGDDALASFDSFLPKVAAPAPDITAALPVTVPSVPRASRKLVKTGTDLPETAETGTDSLTVSTPSTAKSRPAVSTSATPAKPAARPAQPLQTAAPAAATASAMVQPAQIPLAPPLPPPPVGNSLISDSTDLEPETAAPIDGTSSTGTTPLPVTIQIATAPRSPIAALPAPAPTTGQTQPVPVSSPPPPAGQTGPVPLSSAFAPVPDSADKNQSVPFSSLSPTVSADSKQSVPFSRPAVKGPVPVSTSAGTQPKEPVPVSSLAPILQSVPVSAPEQTAGSEPVPLQPAANGSVPVRARSWAVSAAYRTTARKSENVAPEQDADPVVSASVVSPGANIAAGATSDGTETFSLRSGTDKNSLEFDRKQFTESITEAGTGVADSSAVPTNFSSSAGSTPVAVAAVAPRATGRDGGVPAVGHALNAVSGTTPAAFSATSASSDRSAAALVTAKDAVATVVKLAEAQQARNEANTGSVNLGFKFGDDHLGVRVELRSGQIHTQFTTSSPELREALSNQFVALTGGTDSNGSGSNGNSNRPYPFAQPEFAGSSGSSTDQRGSRQNGSQAPAEFAPEGFAPSLSATTTVAATPAASALSVSALRLQAFA